MVTLRACSMVWLLIALAACCLPAPSTAQETTPQECNVPPPPRYLPLPRCAASNASLEDARARAWRFAPKL